MRKMIIAGNWKMNNITADIHNFFEELGSLCAEFEDREVIVAPAFPYLAMCSDLARGEEISIAAQDIFPRSKGAFTGAVGSEMLHDCGTDWVIIGHSERRHIMDESYDAIREKVTFAQSEEFGVILCVGETLEERQSGKLFDVVKEQIITALDDNINCDMSKLVIAYEPVWAIGTGEVATPSQAQEMHSFIRNIMRDMYGRGETRILYGGSVKPANISDLMSMEDIDGALVGGASLKANSFAQLITFDQQ